MFDANYLLLFIGILNNKAVNLYSLSLLEV